VNWSRLNTLIDTGIWSGLSPSAKAVLMVLERRCNEKTGEGYPSRESIMRDAGLKHHRSVDKGVQEIKEKGLFEVMDRGPGAKGRSRYVYKRIPLTDQSTLSPDDMVKGSTLSFSDSQPCHSVTKTLSLDDSKTVNKQKRETMDFDFFLDRYSPEQRDLIGEVFSAIRTTRKSGKVKDTVLLALLKKMARYPAEQVEAGIRIYLDKDCAGQGKPEEYLMGIIRNQTDAKPEPETQSTGSALYDRALAEEASNGNP
jgi:hypothetical protein